MDTLVEISSYSPDRINAKKAIDEAFKEIGRIEKVFSKFDKDSEVSKINASTGKSEVVVSPEMFRLLEDAIFYSKLSEGAFDVTVEPFKKGRYEKIKLNKGNSSVQFLEADIKLDFGGIAKGYAVMKAKEILASRGIKSGLINIGGNIFALGTPPGKDAWRIGIRDPDNKSRVIKVLHLKDRAISTSADYERPSHIIDPATGLPVKKIRSVTVVADSAERADALSTAFFVMGKENALKLARAIGDIELYIIDNDGKIISYP